MLGQQSANCNSKCFVRRLVQLRRIDEQIVANDPNLIVAAGPGLSQIA